jgi:ubiquinone/menaquinone biosynthesis C-methylase UbiE
MGKLDGLRQVVAQLAVTGANALDIGTGVGVGAWTLAEREPATLVSLSIDPQDAVKAKRTLPEQVARKISFVEGNLATTTQLAAATFDVALGDHFVSAISAYSPGSEAHILKEIRRIMRPASTLCFVDEKPRPHSIGPQWVTHLHALWAQVLQPGANAHRQREPDDVQSWLRSEGIESTVQDVPAWEPKGEPFLRANLDGIRESARAHRSIDSAWLEEEIAKLRRAFVESGPAPGEEHYAIFARLP